MSNGFKFFLVLFLVAAVIIGIIYLTDNEKVETKENIVEQSVIPKNLKLEKVKTSNKKGIFTFEATLINTKDTIKLDSVNIKIYDHSFNKVTSFNIDINASLTRDQQMQLTYQEEIASKAKPDKVIYKFKWGKE